MATLWREIVDGGGVDGGGWVRMWWYALKRAGSDCKEGRAFLRDGDLEDLGGVGRCHSGIEDRED
jgi:hypothetical protein